MLGRPDDIVIFSRAKAVAGTLSFPLTLIPLPSKNKGSQMGIFRLIVRKRTDKKNKHRQSKKNEYSKEGGGWGKRVSNKRREHIIRKMMRKRIECMVPQHRNHSYLSRVEGV